MTFYGCSSLLPIFAPQYLQVKPMKIFITLVFFCVIWSNIKNALEYDLHVLKYSEKNR